ncbi:MAG: polysaccharide deacetylase family protein [Lachnospiraceae bacterium]|nr:polysaccharide deacetylase family protein [Lachnospiraceae bacterium]
MFNGKMKALTFSYDDGVTQDIRLIELFNKYGMKATFNINSELLGKEGALIREGVHVNHTKNNPEDLKHIYAGHEVAVHTLTHPNLRLVEEDAEVIRQVEQDRIKLSELCGYEVVGMAYPCGGDCFDERVKKLIRENTGVKYSRTTNSTFDFDLQTDLVEFNPSVYHHVEFDKMIELGKQFLDLKTDKPQIYYVWGHAYEFDIYQNWDKFEAFLEMMSGRDDICYCTNTEALLAGKI